MSDSYSGGCACGAVRYNCSAEPMMPGHCQCINCRKFSGTGHGSLFAVPKPTLELSGEMKFYTVTTDTGNQSSRGFCRECGSPVINRNTGFPEMEFIHAASLDDPERFQPSLVVYTSSGLSWDKVDDALPSFEKMPPMELKE